MWAHALERLRRTMLRTCWITHKSVSRRLLILAEPSILWNFGSHIRQADPFDQQSGVHTLMELSTDDEQRLWSRCLTWDDNTGVLVPPLHGFVGCVCDGKQVGWAFVQLPALVLLDRIAAIDVHGTVRVDWHHHLPNVAVDASLFKPEWKTQGGQQIQFSFILVVTYLFLYNYINLSITSFFCMFKTRGFDGHRRTSPTMCYSMWLMWRASVSYWGLLLNWRTLWPMS